MTDSQNWLGVAELEEVHKACKELTALMESVDRTHFTHIGLDLFDTFFPQTVVYDTNGDALGTIALTEDGEYGFYPGVTQV